MLSFRLKKQTIENIADTNLKNSNLAVNIAVSNIRIRIHLFLKSNVYILNSEVFCSTMLFDKILLFVILSRFKRWKFMKIWFFLFVQNLIAPLLNQPPLSSKHIGVRVNKINKCHGRLLKHLPYIYYSLVGTLKDSMAKQA